MKLLKLNIQRFAAEASVSVTIVSQDVAKNSSVVRLTYTVKRTSGTTYWSTAKDVKFTCDGQTQTKSMSFPSGSVGATKSVSADFTIAHNNDGTKSISYSVKNAVSGVSLSPNPVTGSKTLTTIPRASKPTTNVSSVTLGSTSLTINTNRASSSFTHTIQMKIGNTIVETFTSIGANKTFTPALNTYAPKITTSTSSTCTINCITYNGSTKIGEASTTITLTVPNNSSTQPVVPTPTFVEKNQSVINTGWNVYLKNKSQLSITCSPSGQQGATITSTTFTIGGVAYTNGATLTNGGTLTATARDSRGFTKSTNGSSLTLVDYTAPKIDAALCNRCRQDGTDDDNGEYLKYTFVASVSPVDNKNDKVFRIYYKEKTSSTYEYVDITPNTTDGYDVNYSNVVLSGKTFSSDVPFDIRFSANDTFGIETKVDAEIETGVDLINSNKNGKSIAFGKLSEAGEDESLFEIDKDMTFQLGDIRTRTTSHNSGNSTKYLKLFTWHTYQSSDEGRKLFGKVIMSYGFNATDSQIGQIDFVINTSNTTLNTTYGYFKMMAFRTNDTGNKTTTTKFYLVQEDVNTLTLWMEAPKYCTAYTTINFDSRDTIETYTTMSTTAPSTSYTCTTQINQLEKVLYTAPSNSNVHGTITLNESAANFDYLIIYYGLNSWGGEQMSARVSNKGQKFLNLMYTWDAGQILISTTAVTINGTSIAFQTNRDACWQLKATPVNEQANTGYLIGINKVIGVKNSG